MPVAPVIMRKANTGRDLQGVAKPPPAAALRPLMALLPTWRPQASGCPAARHKTCLSPKAWRIAPDTCPGPIHAVAAIDAPTDTPKHF